MALAESRPVDVCLETIYGLNSGVILSTLLHLPYPDRGLVWRSVQSVFTRLFTPLVLLFCPPGYVHLYVAVFSPSPECGLLFTNRIRGRLESPCTCSYSLVQPGRAAGGGTAPDTRRPSQRRKRPPPGNALPPPPQRATPARKGARCGAGAGSTRPHRPHPGHTGRGTLAARSRGRAAGGGTAPDTRRPSQRWKAPPPGTPFRHPHSEQRRPARAHAVGPVQGPHARIESTRDTRVAEPWLPAPEDGRPGEGQRLTPGAPHNGGRQPPRGRPSASPTASNAGPQGRTLGGRCWVHTPTSTAPGTHGLRNPGSPLQRTGGRGRDSA